MKLFIGIVTLCLCLTPFMGAKAAEYSDEILAELMGGTSKTINAGDTVTVQGTSFIGPEGYIDITEGKLTLQYTAGSLNMTLDGTASGIDEKNLMFFSYGDDKIPINLVVNEGSVFNLTGNMALTTGAPVTFTNNGTVNIAGALEVRTGSKYTGTGTTNLYGKLAVYGTAGGNLTDTKINLFEGANVYSESDVASNLVVGEQDTDTYTWAIGENDKSYTSVSPGVSNSFGYGYTLTKTEVPATEVTNPETTTPDAEVTNPETADSILLYVALAILALGGVTVVTRKLAKNGAR